MTLDNTLALNAALRSVGVKGTVGNLPLVPGIFPTVPVGDLSLLAAAPKQVRGLASHSIWLPVFARAYWQIGGGPILLKRLFLQSTTALVWEMGKRTGLVQDNIPWINVGTGGPVTRMNCMFVNGALAGGTVFAYETMNFPDLNWYVAPGEGLFIQNVANGVGNAALVAFEAYELEHTPIDP